MLKVICGENQVASREYFAMLKQKFKSEGCFVIDLEAANFFEKIESLKETPGLFSSKLCFFAENVVKKLSRKKKI